MLLRAIQEASLEARRNKDTVRAELLVTLYAEALRVGKDKGNRETTDDETVRVIRKFLNGVDESLAAIKDPARREKLAIEKTILEALLPASAQLMSEADLTAAVSDIVAGLPERSVKAMGAVMGQLKARFNGAYDGALANKLARAALSA